eukprot:m.126697 g.126697  ORF g.126697 m.126697 type:complete len:273 (+) comp17385_c0_seq1:120-938(+)
MAGALFNRLTFAGLGISGIALLSDQILYDVDGGHRAVIFDKFQGVLTDVRGEGTHFRIPFIQEPKIFDVRMQWRTLPVRTPSRDLQDVDVTLRILYRPQVPMLPHIFKTLGEDYAERVIPSIGNEILKSIVAQYDAEQLITQREAVSQQIATAMQNRAKDFNLSLDDIALTQLQFGREFTKAVELKQVAEQEAERARFLVERAQHEKDASIIRAQGDAEAAIMVSKALQESGQALIELRKIEAAKDIAHTMSRSRNVAYLPGGQNMLMNLQL